jgi:hypothetical protein
MPALLGTGAADRQRQAASWSGSSSWAPPDNNLAGLAAPLGLNGHGRGPESRCSWGRSRCTGRQQEATVHIEGVQ